MRKSNLILLLFSLPAFGYTVGGTLSGLTSTLVLRLNSGTFHIYPAGVTTWKFDTQFNTGDPYLITVASQPVGQRCTVTNGLGVIDAANVTNVAVACVGTSSATLSWTKPTQNTDGSPLTDLAGYVVSYGTNPASLSTTRILAGANTLTTTINGLTSGATYYFTVASRNLSGQVGPSSSLASKVIQ